MYKKYPKFVVTREDFLKRELKKGNIVAKAYHKFGKDMKKVVFILSLYLYGYYDAADANLYFNLYKKVVDKE